MIDSVLLRRNENQARALGEFAIAFLRGELGEPDESVYNRVEAFHLDSIACAVSAIARGTNAPSILRQEALSYPRDDPSCGVPLLGSRALVVPEKAVAANCSATREWDANGTNFGYNPQRGATRGEFGHNDFYPVAVAAAQMSGCDGRKLMRAMILLDEIRGRLAEVFALRDYKIDHVLHGGIASAVVYGALRGATPERIESAVGMVVAHYVPFRAIRAGHQLSDSKGASAALNAEMAVVSVERSMRGFVGPGDIFRNPQAVFCLFEPPGQRDSSPFVLELGARGDDFAVMGMHFKLGLYEHQSAGAIAGLMDVLSGNLALLDDMQRLRRVRIAIYEPAYSIIGDPAKRDPRTRQSADHSMVYIIAKLLRKAYAWSRERRRHTPDSNVSAATLWSELMLLPDDYADEALFDPTTRAIMEKVEFRHGGEEYDAKYPDGIPTSLEMEHEHLGMVSSGLVMYPEGHTRNMSGNLESLLATKFRRLASLGVADSDALRARFTGIVDKSAGEVRDLFDFEIRPDQCVP